MIVTANWNQSALIRTAKAIGCEVLATDGRPDAPALGLADHTAVVDATNKEDLLRIASEFRADAVLSEQTDVAVPAVAYVCEQLGLPGIGYDTALRTTDKWRMREACRRAGLTTPSYRLATSFADALLAAKDIGLPVVVKPTDNQASRGVTKVMDIENFPDAVKAAFAASRSGRILIEECMSGQESSIESFITGETVHVLGISEKVKCAPPYSFDLQLIYPASFAVDILDEIIALNRAVIRAVGIRMGFAHAEMMITPHGVRLIEIAARGCGARVATDLIPAMTGADVLGLRLRQSLGEPIDFPQLRHDRVGLLRFFELPAGVVRRIRGLREAAALPGVLHLELDLMEGTRLKRAVSGDQRPGFVLLAASSRAQAMAIADEVMALVTVEVT